MLLSVYMLITQGTYIRMYGTKLMYTLYYIFLIPSVDCGDYFYLFMRELFVLLIN